LGWRCGSSSEYLLCKYQALSSNPGIAKKN
jgi:hypothetical protein